MKSGGLVPDDLILRLISNELTTRGWLRRDPSQLLTLASSGMAASELGDGALHEPDPAEALFLGGPMPPTAAAAGTTTLASDSPSASFLLDGFPRTSGQAALLDGLVPINLAVSLRTPVDLLVERISSRWVHEPSGRVYNTGFNAPRVEGRDDVTGEPLVRRADDDADVYRQRLRRFEEASEPLLEFYARKGVLWEVEGLSSNEISPKLYKEFERRFC
jgi:adenylate kinase